MTRKEFREVISLPVDPRMGLKPNGSWIVGLPVASLKVERINKAMRISSDYLAWLAWVRVPGSNDARVLRGFLNRARRGGSFLSFARDAARYAGIRILGEWDGTVIR